MKFDTCQTVTKPNRVNDDWQTASLLAIVNTHEVRVLSCSRLRSNHPSGSCYTQILSPQLNMARVMSPSLSLWINCKCNWKHRERDGRTGPSESAESQFAVASSNSNAFEDLGRFITTKKRDKFECKTRENEGRMRRGEVCPFFHFQLIERFILMYKKGVFLDGKRKVFDTSTTGSEI